MRVVSDGVERLWRGGEDSTQKCEEGFPVVIYVFKLHKNKSTTDKFYVYMFYGLGYG